MIPPVSDIDELDYDDHTHNHAHTHTRTLTHTHANSLSFSVAGFSVSGDVCVYLRYEAFGGYGTQ